MQQSMPLCEGLFRIMLSCAEREVPRLHGWLIRNFAFEKHTRNHKLASVLIEFEVRSEPAANTANFEFGTLAQSRSSALAMRLRWISDVPS